MTITKFGHACLLVEEGDLRVLIDPGSYSTGFADLKSLDAILITHEHQDHVDVPSVKTLVANNPSVQIFCTPGAEVLLATENIPCTQIGEGQTLRIKEVDIKIFGKLHAVIHSTWPVCANVGVMIADRFFYPGDSFTIPPKPVEILALPVGGPWLKLGEAIDYAITVKPKVCFPVHDAMYKMPGTAHSIPKKILEPLGIQFTVLEDANNTLSM